MAGIIYLTGFPGPAGTLDYPSLGRFPIDVGVDPADLQSARGLAYLLRATPVDPESRVILKGPPFPAGMIDYPTPFQVEWTGVETTIYPAASLGRSTAPDDVPPNKYVPGALAGAPINYGIRLFDGIEPTPNGQGGAGVIELLDTRGDLDAYIGLAWDGAALDVLRGPWNGRFADYAVVARLTTAGLTYNGRKKQFRLRDLGWRLEQADLHDEIYGGTGGLDGDPSIAGHPKPYGVGAVRCNVEPKLINDALAIHQLSCSSIQGVDDVRDGAVSLLFDADYPTYEALAAATVPPAHFATCLAKGLIRRGSPIVFTLTCDFRGDADVIAGQAWPHTRGQIARRIATGRGAVKLTDANIDFAALNRMEQEQAATVGFYWSDPITKAEALSEVMAGCLGWWAVRLDGRLALGFVDEPAGAPALTLNFPADFADEPELADVYQPPRRATFVGWRRNYTIQDASRLANESVEEGAALIYGQASRYAGTTDAFLQSIWPTSQVVRSNGGFDEESAALAEAERQQRVMGRRREIWTVKTPCDPTASLIGKTIQVDGYPRYGWGPSRKFICVGMSFASGRAVSLELWG